MVVEDDPAIADLLDLYLRREGHRVYLAGDGPTGLELIGSHRPEVVIMDVGLPGADGGTGMDGLAVCRHIRRSDASVAIIFLTARDDEVDRVLGLELGADDYVTKPFSPREMVARVKAQLRRAGVGVADPPTVTTVGGVEVDLGRHEVRVAGTPVELATQEFELLALLCANRGLALTRRQILDGAWGEGWVGDERTVDVHVRQLRRKLGDELPLATVWGIGYRLG